MQQKYQFTPAMREISGFGGTYEECCRRMLAAALEWLDAHPEADPKFGQYGEEENADAKAISAAAVKAAEAMSYGPSGAQHGAAISHALWIKANGWDAYVREKTHPGGELGIVREKLAKAESDAKRACECVERLTAENHKRAAIIAERVLGWKRYKLSNGQQEAYAPDQRAAVEGIGLGTSLYKLVDDAIAGMAVESEAA